MKPIRLKSFYLSGFRFLIHLVALAWLCFVFVGAFAGKLPGDPVQYLLDFTGIGAFNFLLLSLLISPLSQKLKFAQLMVCRKTLGVYSAIYALAHLGTYIGFELQFEWSLIGNEIISRPYISVGMLSLFILTLLLITSLNFIKRKMRSKWQKLHNFAYLALCFTLLHFLMSTKSSDAQAYLYAVFTLVVLIFKRKKLKNILKKSLQTN